MTKRNANGGAAGAPGGTQSIERAVALLREISARGHFGWRLTDLADRCSLSKGTTHRMLMCLVRERLVKQRPNDRHYLPGPMLFELGLSLPELSALQNKAKSLACGAGKRRPSAAFLFFRSGDDFVCAEREGSTDLKALTIFPGTRRPLATSAGGAAMLLDLPVPEARATARRNLASLTGYGRARSARDPFDAGAHACRTVRDQCGRHIAGRERVRAGVCAMLTESRSLRLCSLGWTVRCRFPSSRRYVAGCRLQRKSCRRSRPEPRRSQVFGKICHSRAAKIVAARGLLSSYNCFTIRTASRTRELPALARPLSCVA